MAYRALIIAIEEYPKARGGLVVNTLPGTLEAGKNFKTWLEKKWNSEGRNAGDTEVRFSSEPIFAGNRKATRDGILTSLDELRRKPQNSTDELFFFFSGHGFSFDKTVGERSDMIIASDFEDAIHSGASCLNLDEIIRWL